MSKYRKKPVEVEAVRYDGPNPRFAEWMDLLGENGTGGIQPVGVNGEPWHAPDWALRLQTVQGEWVTCKVGEWIICESVPGRYYPCADEAFTASYEAVSA